jgi:hypothetical protein
MIQAQVRGGSRREEEIVKLSRHLSYGGLRCTSIGIPMAGRFLYVIYVIRRSESPLESLARGEAGISQLHKKQVRYHDFDIALSNASRHCQTILQCGFEEDIRIGILRVRMILS